MRRRASLLAAILIPAAAWSPVAAQSADPFAGLSAGVLAVARSVDVGDAQAITATVPTSGAVRTAYPGDGSHVDREAAVSAITAAIVSNPSASDALGNGKYRLIAIWIPNAQPDQVFLVGSGIDSGDTRITTVFTVSRDGSSLLAFGRAGDTSGVLGQFSSSGDLRRIQPGSAIPQAAPGPPGTGGGTAPSEEWTPAFDLAALALLALGTFMLLGFHNRSGR